MKPLTYLLSLALVLAPVRSWPADKEKPRETAQPQESLALAILVLGIAVVAGAVVIKVHSKHKQAKGPVRLVLEKSADHVTWVPVVTNTVVLNGEQPMDFFTEVKKDGVSFYRARVENFGQ